jgi:hemin uptake protein HemP
MTDSPAPAPPPPAKPNCSEPVSVSSEELLGGKRQIVIRHGRERYRLILTSSNKLILTK